MTSELKCPICNTELHTTADIFCVCTNDKCKIWGQPIPYLVVVRQIQSQEKLDIAIDSLKNIRDMDGYDDPISEAIDALTAIRRIDKQIERKE